MQFLYNSKQTFLQTVEVTLRDLIEYLASNNNANLQENTSDYNRCNQFLLLCLFEISREFRYPLENTFCSLSMGSYIQEI